MSNFTDNWSRFGSDDTDTSKIYFRKFELYEMAWQKLNMDMPDFALIAAASNGGSIAVVRDDRKKTVNANPPGTSAVSPSSTESALMPLTPLLRPAIFVFSASGRVISQFTWSNGPLLQIGWSSADELILVQNDGRVYVYDMFGKILRGFGMGQEAADVHIVDCRIFQNGQHTGVAVLTNSRRFFTVANVAAAAPVLRSTAEMPTSSSEAPSMPNCWEVFCCDREVRVLLAKEGELYSVDKSGQFQQIILRTSQPIDSIRSIAVSPNQKHVALLTSHGIVIITDTDSPAQPHCEFDCGSSNYSTKQFAWCGNHAAVRYWIQDDVHILLMIGPKKDWINYQYRSPLHLVPEMDSVRIITRETHDMIQKVPVPTMLLMDFASLAPGASLLEAYREYEKLSYKADEYLKLVKDKLDDAISQCIDSAGQEFDIGTQKLLLKAASFGKAFFDNDSLSEKFYQMCKNLRVLNALRFYMVGMPLTWKQFENLSPTHLIERLLCRRQYELAYRICGYLDLPVKEGHAKILLHWSCYKMNQPNEADDLVARSIIGKLEKTPGISFAECAKNAKALGRSRLAVDLLEKETSAVLQIPLLLEFGKEDLALAKAIASGNSDLVYDVILHLKSKMSTQDFLMKIRSSREVFALFIKYCREFNPKMLRDLFFQEDWHTEEGLTFVPEAFFDKLTPDERVTALQNAHQRFERAKDEFNKKITEDQIKLIRYQKKLEEKFDRAYTQLTFHETLQALLQDQQYKLADEFKKEFQIADRHFWFVKVDILARNSHWEELEKFSKSARKPPVGFETFALAAFKYHNRTEAQKYAAKVDEEQKVRYLLKIGAVEEAADVAIKQKDINAMDAVLEKCRKEDVSLVNRILAAKTQLT